MGKSGGGTRISQRVEFRSKWERDQGSVAELKPKGKTSRVGLFPGTTDILAIATDRPGVRLVDS